MLRWSNALVLATLSSLSLAACTTTVECPRPHPAAVVAPAPAANKRNPRQTQVKPVLPRPEMPAAGLLTSPLLRAMQAAPDGEMVVLKSKESGWKLPELFGLLYEKTGISVGYDPKAQSIQTTKVVFMGKLEIPTGRFFGWTQAAAAAHNVILVPSGPLGATGMEWYACNSAKPAVQSRALFVHWEDVDGLADRDGLYITTVIPLDDRVESSRVRSALSQMSTRTAALGKIVDITAPPAVIVTDFAPLVANMRKVILQMGIEYRGPTIAEE